MKTCTHLLRWIGLLAFVPVAGCISPTLSEDTDAGSSGDSTGSATTTMAISTATGSSTSAGPSGSSEATTAGGLPPGSGCCEPHAGPGCNEPSVQTCVCDENTTCCGFDWSAECVELAQGRCAATCEPDATTGDSTTSATSGASGSTGGGTGASTGFGPTGGLEASPCCEALGGVGGCLHQPTQECVCAINSGCCDDAWTAECAALAQSDCNACTSGDCCAPQGSAGCNDPTVESCVCALDDFCCDQTYDEICADLAASNCDACE
ncbi:MAG: hypothetical protein ACRBN8_14425 [Nannocystales bacterium]